MSKKIQLIKRLKMLLQQWSKRHRLLTFKRAYSQRQDRPLGHDLCSTGNRIRYHRIITAINRLCVVLNDTSFKCFPIIQRELLNLSLLHFTRRQPFLIDAMISCLSASIASRR
jgi:hypothetical protein